MQACPKPTNQPTSSGFVQECNYSPDGLGCEGSCGVRNANCEMVQSDDMLYCGCTYCNYDAAANKCSGQCQNLGIDKCISRIAKPKSDADCGCFSCQRSVDGVGNVKCSGSCFKSGLSCKVKRVSAFTITGYSDECVCQA